MPATTDLRVLGDLARHYAELAADPVMDERRERWRKHFSLQGDSPMVLITFGYHNVWCHTTFGDDMLQCTDPFYRAHERLLRMHLFHTTFGDDFILEPWLTQTAAHLDRGGIHGEAWGMSPNITRPESDGGAWKGDPPLKSWDELEQVHHADHGIDEERTQLLAEKLHEAVGRWLPVAIDRSPLLRGFAGDISTSIASMRGLEQLMLDMYESPDELHRLLTIMRDGILQNQQQAEDAGHFSLLSHQNQAMPYSRELEDPQANSGPRQRSQLWGFCASQEYTLVSPACHDEFLFQYQQPIMEHYGQVHYGCCEDLTKKIPMLKRLRNLRSVAVTPLANVAECAAHLGSDYVLSWRPNPTDVICLGFDPAKIKRILGQGLRDAAGCHVTLHLKDVETVEGDTTRLPRWVALAREVIDEVW